MTSTSTSTELHDALADVVPVLAAATPIGLLFGAVGASKGLSAAECVLLSVTVFAGGAQLAAVEIWTIPAPVLALVLSTLLINSRYVLISASLAPKVAHLPLPVRLFGFHVLADENWALSERRAAERPLTTAYFLGMGIAMLIVWTVSSGVGAIIGPLLGDPRRFGADFAFTAIFIGLIVGFRAQPRFGTVVAASAIGAAGAYLVFGSPWHVLVGALAGIGTAAAFPVSMAEAAR
jgi:4-azaleucine resistance transporter AzlC